MFDAVQPHRYGIPTMFSNQKRSDGSTEGRLSGGATMIARGVKMEGDFSSEGDVVIEGEVYGKLSTGGKLTVGSEAVIKADVSANEAEVAGQIEGNLHLTEQLILHASARVKGDVTVERATIESGATLEGKVEIGKKLLDG